MKKQNIEKQNIPEASLKSFKKLASETGVFYNNFINILMKSKSIQEQQELINNLVLSLPKHMQKLYKKGIDIFLKTTQKNHDVLKKHHGQEGIFLLKEFIKQILIDIKRYDPKILEDVLSKIPIKKNTLQYFELIPGIPCLKVEKKLYDTFKGGDKYGGECVSGPEIKFILITIGTKNIEIKHELSHFIFAFLSEGKYLRQEKKLDIHGFERFRTEIISYIIDGSFKKSGFINNYIWGEEKNINGVLIYSRNKNTIQKASDILREIFLLMVVGSKINVKINDFIFPCLISKNFSELRKNCRNLVSKNDMRETLNTLEAGGLTNLIEEFRKSK